MYTMQRPDTKFRLWPRTSEFNHGSAGCGSMPSVMHPNTLIYSNNPVILDTQIVTIYLGSNSTKNSAALICQSQYSLDKSLALSVLERIEAFTIGFGEFPEG